MSKKPIIRWTIGNVSDYGFLCLKKSVELMKQLLGSKCEYAICHNTLNKYQFKKLPNVDILIDSKCYLNIYPVNVLKEKKYNNPSVFWKLYPARIRKECHEIIIDKKNYIDSFYNTLEFFDEPHGDSAAVPLNFLLKKFLSLNPRTTRFPSSPNFSRNELY